jgi:hypothetical protein
MFSALMIIASIAIPEDLERVPVGSLIKDPNSFARRMVEVSWRLAVLKEDVSLWDSTVQSKLDAWIIFAEGWEERSPNLR